MQRQLKGAAGSQLDPIALAAGGVAEELRRAQDEVVAASVDAHRTEHPIMLAHAPRA
tara:strand:- start:112 stop:282 length:171 start_codon:yes stop_codon:yes gene_type:complete